MSKRLLVEEVRWYLALQDGPAEEGKYYDTEAEAKAELKEWKRKGHSSGVCIMSRVIYREPNL